MFRVVVPHVCRRAGAAAVTFAAVGYPKVGNTWLRLTLGRYLQLRYTLPELPLMDIGDLPMLEAAGIRTRGEFTHTPLEWHTQTAAHLTVDNVIGPFAGRRVLLLTRYPLDTLVSLFMQQRHRTASASFTGSLVEFVEHPVFGLDKLFHFHRLWAEHRSVAGAFHLWRYEDALQHPVDAFESVLRFLDEPIDRTAVTRAVDDSSFDNLRKLELSDHQPVYKSSQFKIFATGDRTNPNALHIRRGRAGGYREELPAEIYEPLERRVKAQMPQLFSYAIPPVP